MTPLEPLGLHPGEGDAPLDPAPADRAHASKDGAPPGGEPPAPRVVFLGGFLGAGKTTALLALGRREVAAGRRVCVVTNDQAEGLVDTERFRAAGFGSDEVSGGCFCCRFDDFVARAEALLAAAQPDVILAEPVGSCTDLVATVLRPLERLLPRRFVLAPYVVLVDPLRAREALGGRGATLSRKVAYIFRLQQQEADALAVSKADLLDPLDRAEVEGLLRERFPGRPLLSLSARTGEGLDALCALLDGARGPGRPLREGEIDYDAYAEGEAELGWLNRTSALYAAGPVEIDGALVDLAQALRAALAARRIEIAHAKLSLAGATGVAVVGMASGGAAVQLAQRAERLAERLELRVNVRALGDPLEIQTLFEECASRWRARHGLALCDDAGRAFRPARPVPTHRMR